MNKLIRIFFATAFCLASGFSVAQSVSPIDFMPLNPYRLKSNPAADLPYESVMSILIGNVGLDVQNSTLRYDNLFEFDAQGRPATLNLRQFANSLEESNFSGCNAHLDLFTLYRRLNRGMLTVNYGIKAQGDAKYNDGLFNLLAYGNGVFVGEDNPVNVTMDLNAQANQEFAVGYQINVTDELSVGGRAKLLFGVANVTTDVFEAQLLTDPNTYALRLRENIAMKASMPNVVYIGEDGQLKSDGRFSVGDLFHNAGFGIDLGAEYRFNDQFSVVAAVNDLGFIHWANNNISIKGGVDEIGQFYDNGDFLFNGLDWEQLQSISNDETYREHFLDTLKQYFQLEYAPLDGYNTMLNTNLLLRGNYDLDANNRFSAQVQGQFLGTGFRPALTLAYCGSFLDNFSVCATYTAMPNSYSNFGLGLGAMIKTCHIYLATNNIIGCFKPLNNSGFNVQAGIVFNLFEEGRRTLGD